MSGIVSLFPYDVTPIVELLPALDDVWGEDRWRQSMPLTPHRDTETIFLRRQPGSRPRDVLHSLACVATRHYCHGPIAEAIDAICRFVEGRPARAMLVRLAARGVIALHTDEGIYADHTERFHLPIVTNPGAWLEVDDVGYHLEAGVVYAVNKHVPHCGANDGDEPRIHLIVDCIPESGEIFAA